jgi:hypothetical protein
MNIVKKVKNLMQLQWIETRIPQSSSPLPRHYTDWATVAASKYMYTLQIVNPTMAHNYVYNIQWTSQVLAQRYTKFQISLPSVQS